MLSSYLAIVRRAALATAVAAVVIVAIAGGVAGVHGLTGALAGVALVAAFFGISIVVVGWAAKISPAAMMSAAVASYLVKIIAIALVVRALMGTTALSTRSLGFTAVACVLVWSAAQVITAARTKTLYVEPSGER